MKTEKRTSLIMSLVAALVLVPMVSSGEEGISGPPPTPLTDQMSANNPPVGQPLIPEGVFAVQLVEALRMGQTQDEAQAENMLSAVGIEPKNGWIAGYPVTPPIIGEIEKGVAGAADAGKLSVGKEQATKALGDLKVKLGLNVMSQAPPGVRPGGPPAFNIIYKYRDKDGIIHFTNQYDSIPGEYRDQAEVIRETASPQAYGGPTPGGVDAPMYDYAANPGPEVINNYYYSEGPPVVTYYAPPDPYYYLYAWVPYPFWCSGFYFRGFFILNDFHRRVFFHGHPFFVSNHVVHGANHRVSVVDPVSRRLRGSMGPDRFTSPHVFNSHAAQSSARTILGLSQSRMGSAPFSAGARTTNAAPSTSMGSLQRPGNMNPGTSNAPVGLPPGSSFVPSRVIQTRTFSPPAFSGRTFSSASPRVFSPSAFLQGRSFSAPSYSGRSAISGGGSFGGFHGGGGGFRSGGGGGSRGGGGSGGHR